MGTRGVHQGDLGQAALAPFFAQLRGQGQAPRASSDDDNAVHLVFLFLFSVSSEFNAARCQLPE
jgi:hypothetical protein